MSEKRINYKIIRKKTKYTLYMNGKQMDSCLIDKGELAHPFDTWVGKLYNFDTMSLEETNRFISKNLVMTQDQAEKVILHEIAKLNDGWKPNWGDVNELKCAICYSYRDGFLELLVQKEYDVQHLKNELYIRSFELAEQLIETHGTPYKIMLGVNESTGN